MQSLKGLPESTLYLILQSTKLKKLEQEIDLLNLKLLLAEAEEFYSVSKYSPNVISMALLMAGESISSPLFILWYLCGIFTKLIFSIISLVFLPITLAIGGFYFFSSYKEHKHKIENENNKLDLILLKLYVVDELLKRSDNKECTVENLEIKGTNKNSYIHFRKAINVSFAVAITILSTNFAIQAILAACGATLIASVLISPIGIGVVSAVGLGLGIYYGYQFYKKSKLHEKQVRTMKNLSTKLEQRYLTFEMQNESKKQKKNSTIFLAPAQTHKQVQVTSKYKPSFFNRLNPNSLAIAGTNSGLMLRRKSLN